MKFNATWLATLVGMLMMLGAGCDAGRPPAVPTPRVGVLAPQKSTEPASLQREPFERGLRELGWAPGKTVIIEYRYAEGDMHRLAELADELVKLKPDVIVARAPQAIRAAQRATATIPIVMSAATDPVSSGFVASLARPGGNITGIAVGDVGAKQIDFLKLAVPHLARLAVLTNPSMGVDQDRSFFTGLEAVAKTRGIEIQTFEAGSVADIDKALDAMTLARVDALMVRPDPHVLEPNAAKVVALVAAHRLPATFPWRSYVELGGLMFYATAGSQSEFHHRSSWYVDKILRGAKPAEIAVEQPLKFELMINLKTARELGLVMPSTLLLQATEVIP
jgi:putative ABC transport system substrate-binding protein